MNYGIPYILEDKTGSIIASQFDDIHDRMRLYIRPIQRNELHAAYLIYDDSHPTQSVCLDFNAKNALGTITIGAGGGHVPMGQFLPRVSGSRNREFRASDGQTYTWSRTCKADREWTCVNSNRYHVASYAFKHEEEPEYYSSGATFTVDEGYPHIAVELLATLTIMRHIAQHDL